MAELLSDADLGIGAAPLSDQDIGLISAPATPGWLPGAEALEASNQGVVDMLTFGFGDELMAAFSAPLRALGRSIIGGDEGKNIGERLGDAYEAELKAQRQAKATAEEQHPGAYLTGQIAGGFLGAGKLSEMGATFTNIAKPTASRMMAGGAAEGASYGGVYGLGSGEGLEDRLSKGAQGAALGAVTGGALGAAGSIVAKYGANKAIPTTQDLKAMKDAAYAAAEAGGQGSVSKTLRGLFADRIERSMSRMGINLGQHPKTAGALDKLVSNLRNTDPLNLEHVDLLRRNVLDAAMSGDKSEARMAGIVLGRLDDFIDTVPGGPLWKDAREAYKIYRKAATIEHLIDRASLRVEQFAASGWDNALQVEFRQFVRNDKLMKGFSKAEKEVLRAVARDGVGLTVLRKIGKLSPTSGVIPMLGSLFAASTGNPYLAGGMVAAEIAKQSIQLARRGKAKTALKFMQNVGKTPALTRLNASTRVLLSGGIATSAEQAPNLTGHISAQ